jgi:PadR family transcriptional regulator, regulatory protein PadR
LKNTGQNHFDDRDLYSGLIRLHILHHAVEGPVFGLGMAEELARHGYRISPGTLYPLLHGLERKGYLRATEQREGKSRRKIYRTTPLGQRTLEAAKLKVRELFGELIEGKIGREGGGSSRQGCEFNGVRAPVSSVA